VLRMVCRCMPSTHRCDGRLRMCVFASRVTPFYLVITVFILLTGFKGESFQIRQIAAFDKSFDPSENSAAANLPYFDKSDVLRWNDGLLRLNFSEICPQTKSDTPEKIYKRVRMLNPHVVEVHCPFSGGRRTDESIKKAIGYDASGNVRWVRSLALKSGQHIIRRWLIGAAQTGLVLSDFEVWSPTTGETIYTPPVKKIPSENRTIPVYSHHYATIFRSKFRDFLIYQREDKRSKRSGGVFLFDPEKNSKAHILPQQKDGDGIVVVENYSLGNDQNMVFIAQRLSRRGPGWVAISGLDIGKEKLVFQKRFCKKDFCLEPYVTYSMRNDKIGFSYKNASKQKYSVVTLVAGKK